MGRVTRGLAIVLTVIAVAAGHGQTKPENERGKAAAPPLVAEKVGVRAFQVGQKEYKIPWYRLTMDYNEMQKETITKGWVRVTLPDGSVTAQEVLTVWDRIVVPEGTVTAYVGDYGKQVWCDFRGEMIMRRMAWGVDFSSSDLRAVRPGAGKVKVRWWLYEENPHDDGMMFREGRYHVFCLDHQPVERWKNGANDPACDMSDELDHVIGIIEIRPTFDFTRYEKSQALYVTQDSLVSYRFERRGLPEDSYGVVRGDEGKLRFESGDGGSAPAGAETVQKLLYALNTCRWVRNPGQPDVQQEPAVTRTTVEYEDADGKAKKVVIDYYDGRWYLLGPGQSYYVTGYPYLLYEVREEIKAACKPKK